MNRRGFITGALGVLAAPAIVRVSSIMPVKAFIREPDGGYIDYIAYDGRILVSIAIPNEAGGFRIVMSGPSVLTYDQMKEFMGTRVRANHVR